jgi:hypothetical protein
MQRILEISRRMMNNNDADATVLVGRFIGLQASTCNGIESQQKRDKKVGSTAYHLVGFDLLGRDVGKE